MHVVLELCIGSVECVCVRVGCACVCACVRVCVHGGMAESRESEAFSNTGTLLKVCVFALTSNSSCPFLQPTHLSSES